MGAFTTKLTQNEIVEFIYSWCDEKKLRLLPKKATSFKENSEFEVSALAGPLKLISSVTWKIQSSEKERKVTVIIKPGIFLSISLFLPIIFANACIWYYILCIFPSMPHVLSLLSVVFSVYIFGFSSDIARKKIQRYENSFWDLIRNEHKISQTDLVGDPFGFKVVAAFFVLVVAGCVLVYLMGGIIPFFIMAAPSVVGFNHYVFKKATLSLSVMWKVRLLELETKWVALCFAIMLPFFLFSGMDSVFTWSTKYPPMRGNDNIPRFRSEIMPVFLEERGEGRVTLEEENLEILDSAARNLIRYRIKGELDQEKYESYMKLTREGLDSLAESHFFYMLLLSLFGFFIGVRGILKAAEEWSRTLGLASGLSPIVTPPVSYYHKNDDWKFKIALLITHVTGSVSTVLAGIISIDVFSYMIIKRSLIIGKIGQGISWVFTISRLIFGDAYGLLFAYLILLLFIFPFILFLAKSLTRILKYFYQGSAVLGKTRIEVLSMENIRKLNTAMDFVSKLCHAFKLTMPSIVLCDGIRETIDIRGKLLSKVSVIFINREMVDLLSEEELKAALAHEIGHAVQGLKKVEWLRMLSVLTLYPNYFLTLLLDPVRYETEADGFAIKAGINYDDLIQAIIKSSIVNLTEKPSLWRKMSGLMNRAMESIFRVRGLKMANEFFFGDRILGYTHPFVSERLEAIKEFQKETGAVSQGE